MCWQKGGFPAGVRCTEVGRACLVLPLLCLQQGDRTAHVGREDFLSLQLTYCIRHNGEITSRIRSLLHLHCFPFPCCPTSFCLGFRGKQSSCPGWRGWEDCAATHPRA